MAKRHDAVRTELVAVVVAVAEGAPRVLTTSGYPLQLPAGPLRDSHRSMQAGLRAWVEDQTGLRLGYVEQLYTFADRDRARDGSERMISVSYLALAWPTDVDVERWVSWYDLFPWEDQRGDGAAVATLVPHLRAWAGEEDTERREVRCRVTFALDGRDWLPELALQRYEVLYEAGLVRESPDWRGVLGPEVTGPWMLHDHRRIVATGIGRLRAKIQYRPVVFELMPPEFTLGQLQACVEAIAGQHVHKQNFRRIVEQQRLVEETGGTSSETGGRPARLFRFRREILDARAAGGTKLPRSR